MRRIAWLAGLVPVGVAWACSSAGSHPNALEGNPGQDSGYIVPIRDTGVSDTSIKDSGAPDTNGCFGETDGGCNTLQLCGPALTIANTMNKAPAATGGTILDGTYLLTSTTFYELSGQPINGTIREAIQITTTGGASDGGPDGGPEAAVDSGADAGGTEGGSAEAGGGPPPMTIVQEISDQASGIDTYTWAQTVEPPNVIAWDQVCPSGSPNSFSLLYTATGTTLLIYVEETSGTSGLWEFTYTKQ